MKYLSVCSGIEAATVAWHPLGWSAVAYSEIEKFPSAVLAHHYPDTPNWGDMTKFQEWPDANVAVLVGGTPCQSFSVAGLRKGLADPRGNLALTYLAIAERYRPRWLVWENVPGVYSATSHDAPDQRPPDIDLDADDAPGDGEEVMVEDQYDADEDHAFSCFLAGLSELRYGWAYRKLDAQYFGVPQRRRRVFVIGYLGDWRPPAAVLFERESLQGHPAPRRQEGERTADSLAARTRGGGGLGTDFDCDGGLIPNVADPMVPDVYPTLSSNEGGTLTQIPPIPVAYGGNNTEGPIDVATACRAKGGTGHGDFESETFVAHSAPPITSNPYGDHEARENLLVAHALRGEGFDASEDGTGRGTPLVPVASFDSKDATLGTDQTAPVLTTNGESGHAGGRLAVAFSCKDHGADVGETAPTLRGMGHDGSHANAGGQVAVAFQSKASASNSMNPSETAPALDVGKSDGLAVAFTVSEQSNGFAWERPYAPTLDSHPQSDTSNRQVGIREGMAVRRLTPRECERLQGFPDDYTRIPWRGKPAEICPDGPRYKALGNSFAVPVVKWIGERMQMIEQLVEEPNEKLA